MCEGKIPISLGSRVEAETWVPCRLDSTGSVRAFSSFTVRIVHPVRGILLRIAMVARNMGVIYFSEACILLTPSLMFKAKTIQR